MERIKDLSKVVLRGDGIFGEIIESRTASGLILPDSAKSHFDHVKVVTVGVNVTDIEPGDILLDLLGDAKVFVVDEKKYALVNRGNVILAVKAENFDDTKKIQAYKSKIIN